MDKQSATGVLGLFPELETAGGIQASGRLAWESLVENSETGRQNCYLFCYTNGQRRIETYDKSFDGSVVSASSKLSAVIAALRGRWPVELVLIWHLDLLKLLPFFRLSKARVALFLHGIEAWRRPTGLTQTLLRRVDLFLSNSDYTWERFTQINPTFAHVPHQTIHLGIASPINGDALAPRTPPVTLMISRLRKDEDYKGHREMINAWPLVLKRVPDAELWIAGDGDLRGELERIAAERGLEDKVRFWGRVSEAKKQEMLAHCRCLALPSRGEGFGLVYLEAMRMERPCLISSLDAGREVVNPPEAGLAIDPTQPRELVEAICQLLVPSPAWEQWSRQARRRYESFFTTENFQRRLRAALFPAS